VAARMICLICALLLFTDLAIVAWVRLAPALWLQVAE
jgi:hypothetical protein